MTPNFWTDVYKRQIPAHVKGDVFRPKGLELISVKNVREAIREALG